MRLERFEINKFRSIDHVVIDFPKDKPVILFGPNNVGKSNIFRALDCLLGEKYPTYIDFQDSDYFMRDKAGCPNINIVANFDEDIYCDKYSNCSSIICLTTNYDEEGHLIHDKASKKIWLKTEDRNKCQFIFVDATRDISRQLSYYSQYSILSRMTKKMHTMLASKVKDELNKTFLDVKKIFETVPEYKNFYDRLQSSFNGNVDGFEHQLEIDLSAYDPNNYFNSLKIIAKDEGGVRSFDEFGTGEQQILLMSFIKAYAETFVGENFIFGIEEPESHLHPLAQKWLSNNINNLASSGIQVIITSHSPEFLDILNLEGFVKVYKDSGTTKTIQNNAKTLAERCVSMKANPGKTNESSVFDFYKTNTFYDQLKGFFARKIILVEGQSEVFALPYYFSNCGYDLIKNGVEIIDCKGKSQVARNFRLFNAYEYDCFCLFDADDNNDERKRANKELSELFGFDPAKLDTDKSKFINGATGGYGYFGKDFESYMVSNFEDYSTQAIAIDGTKIFKAKVMAETNGYEPAFISKIADSLGLTKIDEPTHNLTKTSTPITKPAKEEINIDEIPF